MMSVLKGVVMLRPSMPACLAVAIISEALDAARRTYTASMPSSLKAVLNMTGLLLPKTGLPATA